MPIGPDKNFEVFNEEIEFKLKELGDLIGGQMPEGFGYTLLFNSFGKNTELFYTTNLEMEDLLKVLETFVRLQRAKLQQEPPALPPGDVVQ